ncbi:MAG: hypothetical protein LBS43_07665 [Prevotellaceae bacterium]|jgi:hypothetical protein|nr:hypothetical protein [Prevotellaceae bacterium]
MKKRLIYLVIALLVTGCGRNRYSPAIEEVLQQAGDNRSQLEKVLKRYSHNPADSLKLRAAEFLITNMPDKYSVDFQSANKVLKTIKNNGLSCKTIDKCISILDSEMNTDDELVRQVKDDIKTYLIEEKLKVKDDKDCLHASSDIIESLFGTYKFRRSKNRLDGITPYVLILPLITRMGKEKKRSNINFKETLENVYMKDLETWKVNNLTENLAVKRKKTLVA